MGELAKRISKYRNAGVLEPIQKAESIEGLVQELKNVLAKYHSENKVQLPLILIGHSWGAWLAVIFAVRHPELVSGLILIGSGPFEEKYAPEIMQTRLSRMNPEQKLQYENLTASMNSADPAVSGKALQGFGRLMQALDSLEALPEKTNPFPFRMDLHEKIWKEADELRKTGRLLELVSEIKCPVAAIHGDWDPHPAEGIRLPLSQKLGDFRFHLLENCGHKPWIEKKAGNAFDAILREEIDRMQMS